MKNATPLTTAGSLLVLAVVNTLYAQETTAVAPAQQPEPEATTVNSWFNEKLPKAITDGKLMLDVRGRWEHADQEGLENSNAFTVRTRLGYQTASFYNFQGLLEFENITAIGNEDNYNQTGGLNPDAAGRTPILDPPITELNQAWISYNNFDTTLKGGRQRIILDNHRFVGNVGWRQNEQTFDAISLQNTSLDDTTLFYGFIHNINRVVGDDHPAGDFHSKAHLFNASYAGFKPGKLTGYAYLLDIQDTPAASANTFGASFAGAWPVNEDVKVNYRAEFAWQTDAGDNATDYEAEYLNLELGGSYKHFNAGAGYELLGSDNGVGFSTPLATLHAFNGWADVFLATPGDGLQDIYGWVGCTLPGQFPLKVIYHQFYSDDGNDDYGSEIDAVISRKLGKHWTALAKYAHYDGDGPFASRDKLWLQVEFSY